ncbi:hypothetical protein [Saccharothrix variisporea]|uniref:Band 7 domain-containing protein n=1 Tax=Saccharothrix variisporea TaxID=543527 RepID=A0A495XLU2_9PSEU|nr:hypothetical protein [Saccharothrix variisporea]RKT73896.1 hypothetical protein DFJ66_7233 [Saccharothrix variisporea]
MAEVQDLIISEGYARFRNLPDVPRAAVVIRLADGTLRVSTSRDIARRSFGRRWVHYQVVDLRPHRLVHSFRVRDLDVRIEFTWQVTDPVDVVARNLRDLPAATKSLLEYVVLLAGKMTPALARPRFEANARSLAETLPIDVRDVVVDVREAPRGVGFGVGEVRPYLPPRGTKPVPVTIYLSEEAGHERVEAAVEELLRGVGGEVVERDEPIIGSWFRRMRARIGGFTQSEAGQEMAAMALHAAETRLVHLKDAEVTAKMMENLGPVLEALQPSAHAVVRVGALLIVKVDGAVAVHQLTAWQQLQLDHRPELALSPHDVMAALNETEQPAVQGVEQPALEVD